MLSLLFFWGMIGNIVINGEGRRCFGSAALPVTETIAILGGKHTVAPLKLTGEDAGGGKMKSCGNGMDGIVALPQLHTGRRITSILKIPTDGDAVIFRKDPLDLTGGFAKIKRNIRQANGLFQMLVQHILDLLGRGLRALGAMWDPSTKGLIQQIQQNVIDLRLYTNLAVHSDMIQFCDIVSEDPEVSALQLTNVLFATPQISVRLDRITEDQRRMLHFWLHFMSEKRNLLQKSVIEPHRPDMNYSRVRVHDGKEELFALYGEHLCLIGGKTERSYVVNAVDHGLCYVGANGRRKTAYRLLNCMGEITEEGSLLLDENPKPLRIPFNGMAIFE